MLAYSKFCDKLFKSQKVLAVVGCIEVVGVLTRCALLYCTYNSKATQMKGRLMLYAFELIHNTMEAAKNVCHVRGEGTVNHSNLMVQEIFFSWQDLDDQVRLGRPKHAF